VAQRAVSSRRHVGDKRFPGLYADELYVLTAAGQVASVQVGCARVDCPHGGDFVTAYVTSFGLARESVRAHCPWNPCGVGSLFWFFSVLEATV
jgi:hypothetical protein